MSVAEANQGQNIVDNMTECTPSIVEESQNVRVAVRVRPLVARELLDRCRECINEDEPSSSVSIGKRRFTFDHVFGKQSQQVDVFDTCAKQLVDGCFKGYNATVLAYGQTGSGKTFTMGSGINLTATNDEVGIIPRAIERIFHHVNKHQDTMDVRISCSFLEIYNEQVKDLLHPDTPTSKIAIREQANGSILVTGIREEQANTAECLSRFLVNGAHVRTTGSTLMNEQSSRSHAVFSITVEQKYKQNSDSLLGTEKKTLNRIRNQKGTIAKFHLVDLAGSERNKKTGTVGTRFKESVTINQGLLALGNVISALGDERKRCSHIPYRESKLTRLLQDSLGGNSRTVMIACVSSAESSLEETVNTLKYAHRARNIKNKPIVNQEIETTERSPMTDMMRRELDSLQQELADLENLNPIWSNSRHESLSTSLHITSHESDRRALSILEKENNKLKNDMQNFEISSKEMMNQISALKSEKINSQYHTSDFIARFSRIVEFCIDVEENMPDPSEELMYIVQLTKSCANSMPSRLEEYINQSHLNNCYQHDLEIKHLEAKIVVLEKELQSKQKMVQQREATIAEVHEDLARDEIIFSEKLEELRKTEMRAERAEKELHALKYLFQKSHSNTFVKEENQLFHHKTAQVTSDGRGALAVGHNPLAIAAESDDEVVIDVSDESNNIGALQKVNRDRGDIDDMINQVNAEEKNHQKLNDTINVAEIEARERKKAFEISRGEYEEQLCNLSESIEQKELMIQELMRTELEARTVSQELEQRAKVLEEEVKAKESEVQSLLVEIDQLDNSVARTEEEKRKLRNKYEEKLRKFEAQLVNLRQQKKEEESTRVTKLERKSELRIAGLTNELDRMKQQQETLKRRMSVAEDRHNAAEQDHNRRRASLKKDAEKSHKRVKELEIENEKQRAMLKKKDDEVALKKQRIKQLEGIQQPNGNVGNNIKKDGIPCSNLLSTKGGKTGSAMSPAKTPTRNRARLSARRSSNAKLASPSSNINNIPSASDSITNNLKRVIQDRVQCNLRDMQIVEELARLSGKKGELSEKKKILNDERNLFQNKKQKRAKERSNEIMHLHIQTEKLSMAVEAQATFHENFNGETVEFNENKISTIEGLKEEFRKASARKVELEDEQRAGIFLTLEEENTLAELDDNVDALDTENEYLCSAIADLEDEREQLRVQSESLTQQCESMTLHDAKLLVGDLMDHLVVVKSEKQQATHRANTMEVTVAEKEKKIGDLGGTVRLLEMSTDKRVSEIQKVHDEQVDRIFKQINAVGRSFAVRHGSYPSTNEEHISYTSESKGLNSHRSLEVKGSSCLIEEENQSQEGKVIELERKNKSLLLELQNYKAHMHRIGHAVKISRDSVRPVSAEIIQGKKKSTFRHNL